MSSERKLFLHVGTHKTGTTSIQRLLQTNAALLARYGLYVPGTGRPEGHDGHHNIAWELTDDVRFDARFGNLDALADEIASCGMDSACVSSEDFEYLLARPYRLHDFARAATRAGFQTNVIVYLREPNGYARSLYRELLKHGITETEAEFHAGIARNGAFQCHEHWVFQFDRRRLLEPFERIFGLENMIVREYDPGLADDALLREFLTIVAGSAVHNFDEFEIPERLNRSDVGAV